MSVFGIQIRDILCLGPQSGTRNFIRESSFVKRCPNTYLDHFTSLYFLLWYIWFSDVEGALAAVFSSNGSWCAVSPDGKWIAGNTESDRKTVFIWDSETGLLLTSFGAHSDYIRSVTFSPDSKQVLSASDDKTIRVHNLNL